MREVHGDVLSVIMVRSSPCRNSVPSSRVLFNGLSAEKGNPWPPNLLNWSLHESALVITVEAIIQPTFRQSSSHPCD